MRLILRVGLLALSLLLGLGLVAIHATEAAARQSMSFSPGGHGRPHAARGGHVGHRGHAARAARGRGRPVRAGRTRPHGTVPAQDAGGGDDGPAAKAVPGKGFTMENGILTYPAPARFQPKNLRAR